MRLPLKDHNDRWNAGRVHDEAAIANDLQAAGLSRSDALRIAAKHVAWRCRIGVQPGAVVSVGRASGDNGGPVLDDLP